VGVKVEEMTENETRKKALLKYNQVVEKNIEKLKYNDDVKNLSDPDDNSLYSIEVNGICVKMAQDGLCGNRMIKEFAGKNIKRDYKLIREGMFDTLAWPAYAMSINQMRYAEYRDRIDLLLKDIERFYDVIGDNKELTLYLVTKMCNSNCKLARAYIFPLTFYWLCSFNNYYGFLNHEDHKLIKLLMEEKDGTPRKWVDAKEGFCKAYYDTLIKTVIEYRKNEGLNIYN
jgi:hypothetical protein